MAKYCGYSKHEQYRISEYFKYRQYSRVSNHIILQVQAVSRVFNPEILEVQAVSRVLSPEILRVQAVSRVLDPKKVEVQAESRVVLDPKILPVQAESEVSNLRTAKMPNSNTIYQLSSLGFLPAGLPSLLLLRIITTYHYYLYPVQRAPAVNN